MGNCCATPGENHVRQFGFWCAIIILVYANADQCDLDYYCLLRVFLTWIGAFAIIISVLRVPIDDKYGHVRCCNVGAYYSDVELSPPTHEESPLADRPTRYRREPIARYRSGGATSACITADESILSDTPLETFAIEGSSLLARSIESGHLERSSFRGTSIGSGPMEGISSPVNVPMGTSSISNDPHSHGATSTDSGPQEGTSSSIVAMESATMGVSSVSRTTNDSIPMTGSSPSDCPMESLHTDELSPKPEQTFPCWNGI